MTIPLAPPREKLASLEKTKAKSKLYRERRPVTPTVRDRVTDDGYEL